MRSIALLLLAGAVLGSCATTTPEPIRSAKNEQRYQEMLAGKVAQPEADCLPQYNTNDMTVIDERTLLFRLYSNRIYQVRLSPGCNNLGLGPYALLTKFYGNSRMCRGDISQVVDTMAGMTVGSCVVEHITPFVKPGT